MKIESDLEFYCYLKQKLPVNYNIISEPSTAYYSEWMFNYSIYKDSTLYKKYSGDFREISEGKMIQEANLILSEIHKNV